MQLSRFLAIVALALPAWAQNIQFTSVPQAVQAGQSYTITWATTDTGPVTISLKNGAATNLQTVGVLTTNGAGGSYTWQAPADLANGDYAFQISANAGTDVNYSGMFVYSGGSGTAATPAASSAASAATSAATAASSAAASSGATSVMTSIPTGASTMTTATTKASTSVKSLSVASTSAGSTSTPTATATSTVPTGAASYNKIQSPAGLVFGAILAMIAI